MSETEYSFTQPKPKAKAGRPTQEQIDLIMAQQLDSHPGLCSPDPTERLNETLAASVPILGRIEDTLRGKQPHELLVLQDAYLKGVYAEELQEHVSRLRPHQDALADMIGWSTYRLTEEPSQRPEMRKAVALSIKGLIWEIEQYLKSQDYEQDEATDWPALANF